MDGLAGSLKSPAGAGYHDSAVALNFKFSEI